MPRNSERFADKSDIELIDYLDALIIKRSETPATDRGALYELVQRYEKAIGRKLT